MFDRLHIAGQTELSIVSIAAGPTSGVPGLEETALWIDGLLNEALDESFPASDPISSLKFD